MPTRPPRAAETRAAEDSLVDLRCSVAVIRDGRVLLLHRTDRPDDPGHGDWVLPGGRPRAQEGMVACARRETREETGLDVVVHRCLFVLEVTGSPPDTRRGVELVFEGIASPGRDPESLEPDRHARFVDLADLPRLGLRPPIAGHLRAAGRRGRAAGAPYLGNLWRPDGSGQGQG